jgi:hypothetical protein
MVGKPLWGLQLDGWDQPPGGQARALLARPLGLRRQEQGWSWGAPADRVGPHGPVRATNPGTNPSVGHPSRPLLPKAASEFFEVDSESLVRTVAVAKISLSEPSSGPHQTRGKFQSHRGARAPRRG